MVQLVRPYLETDRVVYMCIFLQHAALAGGRHVCILKFARVSNLGLVFLKCTHDVTQVAQNSTACCKKDTHVYY